MGCGQSAIRHPNSKQKVTVDGAEHKTSKTKTEQKERTITVSHFGALNLITLLFLEYNVDHY